MSRSCGGPLPKSVEDTCLGEGGWPAERSRHEQAENSESGCSSHPAASLSCPQSPPARQHVLPLSCQVLTGFLSFALLVRAQTENRSHVEYFLCRESNTEMAGLRRQIGIHHIRKIQTPLGLEGQGGVVLLVPRMGTTWQRLRPQAACGGRGAATA